jgi:hypothetical protein
MNDLLLIAVYILGITQGVTFGYLIWAPNSPFKQGLLDGLSFKFLWGKK